jgi:Uncharacterized protein conserved in bacteria
MSTLSLKGEGIMSRTLERKEHPLSMRIPEADIAIIDRAARLHGRSRTDFVRDAAVKAAEEALMETPLVRLSEEGFQSFIQILSAPGHVVPELVQVLQRQAPWEQKAQNIDK